MYYFFQFIVYACGSLAAPSDASSSSSPTLSDKLNQLAAKWKDEMAKYQKDHCQWFLQRRDGVRFIPFGDGKTFPLSLMMEPDT